MKEQKLLPHRYLNIGLMIGVLSFVMLIVLKFTNEFTMLETVFRNVLLMALFIVSVSKGKEEDEMTLALRGQAFAFAFVWGVLYAFFQPLANWLVGLVKNPETAGLASLSVTQVLLFMLLIQIASFHYSKRKR